MKPQMNNFMAHKGVHGPAHLTRQSTVLQLHMQAH